MIKSGAAWRAKLGDLAGFDTTVWSKQRFMDAVLAGLGLASSFALMGALEKPLGLKLFAPPMMASGIIFFSPVAPPNLKGFLSGTVGCATLSATVLALVSRSMLSPVAAQGAAAGALLVWYKISNSIFPPAAVVCVMMSGADSPLGWLASPWLAGHACLYAGAKCTSKVRAQARYMLTHKRAIRNFGGLPNSELKKIFRQFDLSRDGSLDAAELCCALRVAVGADLTAKDCQSLINMVDRNGDGTLDFDEFLGICRGREIAAPVK